MPSADTGAIAAARQWQPSTSASTSDLSTPQFDDYWNFQSVIFQVEGTLFSVLKHGFLAERTTHFETMLSPPSGHKDEDPHKQKRAKGSSADDPIVLEDTSVKDFRAFLRVLYPVGAEPVVDYEDWFGVLRLSHRWEFVEIRSKAITALSQEIRFQSPDVKIHLGRRFQVRRWLKAGLAGLVLQKNLEMTELQEAPYCFDHESVAKIFYIQSKAWRRRAEADGDLDLELDVDGAPGRGLRGYVASQVAVLFRAEIAKAGFHPRGMQYFPEWIISSDSDSDSY